MGEISREFSAESVKKMLSPARQQLSLNFMLQDIEFRDRFRAPVSATAVTRASKAINGHLVLLDDAFSFLTDESTRLVGNGLLILLFECAGKEYFLQSNAVRVFQSKIDLAPLDPRFFRRTSLGGPANLWVISEECSREIVSGKSKIQRRSSFIDKDSRTGFFVRDQVRNSLGEEVPLRNISDSVVSSIVSDLSRGGCSLLIKNQSGNYLEGQKLGYIEMTLRGNQRSRNVSSFLVVKKTEIKGSEIVLRCAFIEPISEIPSSVVDGSCQYTFDLGSVKKVILNGRNLIPEDLTGGVRLPFGHHLLEVTWNNGRSRREVLFIGQSAEGCIKLDWDDSVGSA